MRILDQRSFLSIAIFLLSFSLSFLTEEPLFCQSSESTKIAELTVGESEIIEVKDIKRFLILDPEIVFAKIISADKLKITAKAKGQTFIHIWDEKGLWSLKVNSEIKQIRITQEMIRKKEIEERRISSLKLDYHFDYQTRRRGLEIPRVKQEERVDSHRFILSGLSPYGNIDSLFWFERRSVLGVGKRDVFWDDRNLTFKLLKAKIGPLCGFDLILGDNYLDLLSFTFAGHRFRGITYGTHEHLKHLMRDRLSQPLEFTLFWVIFKEISL